jgi:hypothetical protein
MFRVQAKQCRGRGIERNIFDCDIAMVRNQVANTQCFIYITTITIYFYRDGAFVTGI